LTHDSCLVTIEAVEKSQEVAPVFNFRVADFHTYYVGSPDWGFDVWVHNTYVNNGDGTFTVLENGRPVTLDQADFDAWKAANPNASGVPTELPTPDVGSPARVRGDRMTSGDSASQQYEGIQKAQQAVRQEKLGKRIDSIEKSRQREVNALGQIQDLTDLADWE
jgi:hypothetical protein